MTPQPLTRITRTCSVSINNDIAPYQPCLLGNGLGKLMRPEAVPLFQRLRCDAGWPWEECSLRARGARLRRARQCTCEREAPALKPFCEPSMPGPSIGTISKRQEQTRITRIQPRGVTSGVLGWTLLLLMGTTSRSSEPPEVVYKETTDPTGRDASCYASRLDPRNPCNPCLLLLFPNCPDRAVRSAGGNVGSEIRL